MKKIKVLIKERWKFYLVGYLIGYVVSIIGADKSKIITYIPIKVFPFCMSILLGSALYNGYKKQPIYEAPIKGFKYIILVVLILLITKLLHILLRQIGIDITPLLGFPD